MTEQVPKKPKVLVVDDLPENEQVLRSFLEPQGFNVLAAYNGADALQLVDTESPDVILLDLMMPGMSGYEVCAALKQDNQKRHIPVIIITGMSDREANIKAIQAGADDFIVKPFDRVLLKARINSSLKTKWLQDEILKHKKELELRVAQRTQQLLTTQQVTVFSLAKLAESRDTETGDHLERMRSYAHEIALELKETGRYPQIDDNFVEQIYQSSPLHDIGKVGIPDAILLKPDKLTKEEFDIMKSHTVIGGDTLKAADTEAGGSSFLSMGCEIAYFHHEKWNGDGYPHGISGTDIPLAGRIVALADVYDALSSKRPYKEPFSHERSKNIILEGNGSHFDPDIVQAFLNREEQFIEIRAKNEGTGDYSPLEKIAQLLKKQKEVAQ